MTNYWFMNSMHLTLDHNCIVNLKVFESVVRLCEGKLYQLKTETMRWNLHLVRTKEATRRVQNFFFLCCFCGCGPVWWEQGLGTSCWHDFLTSVPNIQDLLVILWSYLIMMLPYPRRWSCFFNTNYRYMFTFYLKKTTCDWYNYIQYIQYTPFYVIKTSTKKNTWEGDYLVLQSKSNYACVPFLSSMTTSNYVYGPTEQPTPSWT